MAAGQDIQAVFGIPVIYLLADAPAQVGDPTGHAAPSYYLLKPVDRKALYRILEQCAAGGQWSQAPSVSAAGEPFVAIRRSFQVLWEQIAQVNQEACEVNQQAAQICGQAKEASREVGELHDAAMRRRPPAQQAPTPQDNAEEQHPRRQPETPIRPVNRRRPR